MARALGYNEDVLPLSTVDGAVSIAVEKFQNNPSGGDASATTGTGPNEEGAVGAKDPSPSSAFKPSMLIDLEKGSPMELERKLPAQLRTVITLIVFSRSDHRCRVGPSSALQHRDS